MNAVVFDLELVKRFKKGQLSEIVEIGACKVDIAAKAITDQFQLYISPKSGYVSKSTRKFIKMKKEDMAKAVPFSQGIELFSKWLGEHYYLCSWGRDDRVHFINQCIRNRIKLDWFVNYNDIQQQLGKLLTPNVRNQLGLQNALELAGIEATGLAHRGIDDAINTAELLIKYLDQVNLQKNNLSEKDIAQYEWKMKRARFENKERVTVPKQASKP